MWRKFQIDRYNQFVISRVKKLLYFSDSSTTNEEEMKFFDFSCPLDGNLVSISMFNLEDWNGNKIYWRLLALEQFAIESPYIFLERVKARRCTEVWLGSTTCSLVSLQSY